MSSIPMVAPIYFDADAFEANQAYWAAKRAPRPVNGLTAAMLSRPASVIRLTAAIIPLVLAFTASPVTALIAFKILLALTGWTYNTAEKTQRVNRFILAECIVVPASGVLSVVAMFL